MFVIPSVDILNGKCVQLINGKIETAEIFGSPQNWIKRWMKDGADLVHVIDLNAALGIGSNKELIFDIIKNNDIKIQVGGGIRTEEYAVELIKNGAERIIIGSKVMDQKFLKNLNKKILKRQIMAALDLKNEFVVMDGWKKVTDNTFNEIKNQICSNIGSILSTDTDSEGLLKGPDPKLLGIIKQDDVPIYISGGFSSMQDVKLAEKLGFSGVVVGRALYKKKLDFKELW